MKALTVLFLIALAAPSFAQDSLNVRRVGQLDLPGYVTDIVIRDNLAYVTDEWTDTLRVVDISNPFMPVLVGMCYLPGSAHESAVVGNYAYIADDTFGLRILDIANPAQPSEVGYCLSPTWASGIAVSGNFAFVASTNGLRAINVSDPTNPIDIGRDSTIEISRIAVSGHYAYVYDDSSLRIIDVTDPTMPTELSRYITGTSAKGIFKSGDFVYCGEPGGLRIINIANPSQPVEYARFRMQTIAWDIFVSGNFAYVAAYGSGLRIIAVTHPAQPVEVGFYNPRFHQNWAYGVAVSGHYAFVAEDGMLRVYDCSAATSVHEPSIPRPSSLSLSTFPNPFNAVTRLHYDLARTARVDLQVFDLNGRLVETLASKTFNAGEHEMTFDGNNLATGVYLARLQSGSLSATQKLLLLK